MVVVVVVVVVVAVVVAVVFAKVSRNKTAIENTKYRHGVKRRASPTMQVDVVELNVGILRSLKN